MSEAPTESAASEETPKRNPVPMIIGALVAVAVIAGVVVVLVSSGEEDSSAAKDTDAITSASDLPEVEADGPVPDITFTYFDETEGTFADFAGKPLVINFFASWCPPCIQEMPDFEEVFQEVGDEVQFLGMNRDDTAEGAREIADQTGVTFTLAVDPTDALYREIGGIVMPTTIFVDAGGEVVKVHNGIMSKDELTQVIETQFS